MSAISSTQHVSGTAAHFAVKRPLKAKHARRLLDDIQQMMS